jgi:hypothetical protein
MGSDLVRGKQMYAENPFLTYFFVFMLFLIAVETLSIKLSTEIGFWKALGVTALINLVAVAMGIAGWALGLRFAVLTNVPKFSLIGFGITVVLAAVINDKILERKSDLEQTWGPSICMTVLVYVGIFIFSANMLSARRPAWESRAKGTLRSIGSAELAYKTGNTAKQYGSFKALLESQDIASGYTLGNMIENYSMTWQTGSAPSTVSAEFPYGTIRTFTVIAWPAKRKHFQTFAVTEDMVVRVYNPKNNNKVHDVKSWDPIL